MTNLSGDPARRKRVEAVFEDALELPGETRARFVARACGSDEAMAAQVMELLRAHDREEGILDAPPGRDSQGSRTSDRLGPYRILHRLGSGGMADVYLAVREDAFMRRVALKIMRGQAWGETARQRFETERQIMASLSHPNIAQLLDGGMTDDGAPYLVMEYVEGLPLTEYCDRQGLTIAERLSLFRKVCAAVHHAHQNLVIHRDLKPSNIFVTTQGEPKLLDFGIAKLQQPASSGLSQPVTIPNLRALTPQYASPEQVRGDPLTTASDVYSLGVILYELLTGRPPFPFKDAAPAAAFRAISEVDPKPPSVKVRSTDGTTAEGRDRRASARGMTPDRLAHRLRGDLDAIVMTALRKEPGRRYGSVEQLSSDLDRHLSGEAVLAVGSGRAYRLRKFLTRHRMEAGAAATAVIFVVLGLIVAIWQAGIAREERDRANRALQQAQASSDFLLGLFQADDPQQALSDTISARTMLERGLAEVDALDTYPELRARLLTVLGRAHHSLGTYDRAAELLGNAVRELEVDEGNPLDRDAAAELARTLAELADVLRIKGDYTEALSRARQARDLRARYLGADHADVATSLIQIASLLVYVGDLTGADSLARTALAIRRESLGEDHPAVTNAMDVLAALALRRGDLDESERLLREAVARRRRTEGPEAPEHAKALLRLAEMLTGVKGAHSEAEAVYRRALALLVPSEPDRSTALAGLAEAVAAQGRWDEGIRLYREAIEDRATLLSPSHASVADLLNGLGAILLQAGDLQEAEATYRRALDIWEARLGPEHPAVAYGLSGLARVWAERGDWDQAEARARQALAVRQDALAEGNVLIMRSQVMLGGILGARNEFEEADSLLQAALASLLRDLPPDHPEVRAAHAGLARLYDRWGKPEEAARHRAFGGGPPPGRGQDSS